MIIDALHNRPSVEADRWPTVEEAAAIVEEEWPTASEQRRRELAEGLQLVALNNPNRTPAKPARPKRTIADLQREWCSAPPAARRIFKNNIHDFIRAFDFVR